MTNVLFDLTKALKSNKTFIFNANALAKDGFPQWLTKNIPLKVAAWNGRNLKWYTYSSTKVNELFYVNDDNSFMLTIQL